ncbi:MAG: hypothetical protein EZS28_046522, partial [Streblomastix strix]
MFFDFPKNQSLYAITASAPNESSFAEFCGLAKYGGTCLSNQFAQSWMKQSDDGDLQKITIKEQFENSKKKVKGSHVQQYGDPSLITMRLSEFQSFHKSIGEIPDEMFDILDRLMDREQRRNSDVESGISVPQPDVHLMYMKQRSTNEEFET